MALANAPGNLVANFMMNFNKQVFNTESQQNKSMNKNTFCTHNNASTSVNFNVACRSQTPTILTHMNDAFGVDTTDYPTRSLCDWQLLTPWTHRHPILWLCTKNANNSTVESPPAQWAPTWHDWQSTRRRQLAGRNGRAQDRQRPRRIEHAKLLSLLQPRLLAMLRKQGMEWRQWDRKK